MKQIRLKTLPISVILSLFIVFCISDTSKATGNAAQLPGMLMLLFSDDKSSVSNSYIPPVISGATRFNRDYYEKMIAEGKPTQETPWGFQEIMIEDKVNHTVSSLQEYNDLIAGSTSGKQWSDNKTHIIKFIEGTYIIPLSSSYYIALIPSRTIIEGAGMGKTVFIATHEIDADDSYHFRKLFNMEYATHDVVVREISFYNETQDNKWGLFHSNGSRDRENYLFQNIEFDDVFGAIGMKPYDSNFITFRGLRKRIGNTTQRITDNFNTPVPVTYQFNGQNNDNVQLAGQIGMRTGNSVVFHDCVLGDTISATIDTYNNYIEMVGMGFINPLHACPSCDGHPYVDEMYPDPVVVAGEANANVNINDIALELPDGDGIDDQWELQYFGSLDVLTDTGDYDHDGYSDLQEYENYDNGLTDKNGDSFDPTAKNAPYGEGYRGAAFLSAIYQLLLTK